MKELWIQRFKNCLKNNRGIMSLEILIGTIISIMIIFAIIDVFKTSLQHTSISTTLDYVTRIVGEQGGVEPTVPSHYTKEGYLTSGSLYQYIASNLANIGISDSDWSLTIDGQTFTEDATISGYTYKTRLVITLTYRQDWFFLNKFIPGDVPALTRRSTRHVLTSYLPRTGTSSDIEIIL